MTKKYELTTETKDIDGHTVYRIKALKSFDTIIGRKVNTGDLGGWVESEKNLSQNGDCWLFDDAADYENSRRCDNSVGYENSRQFGNSRQFDNSWQYGFSQQYGNSIQYGSSHQFGNSQQFGHSWQFDNSRQSGHSRQYSDSRQFGDSWQYDNSCQFGDSQQYGNSMQGGDSQQFGHSRQCEHSVQSGDSWQYGDSQQCGGSHHRTGDDDGSGNILCIGPCGDLRRTITIQPDNTITAGCFHGNFDEFKRAVVEKYGEDYGSYSVCIAILQTAIKQRG